MHFNPIATHPVPIADFFIGGGHPLALIAGPCVIENRVLCVTVAEQLKLVGRELQMPVIFKSSFDKANRLSVKSFRGPGIEEGLEILAEVKSETGLPLLTDIHEAWQAGPVSQVVDVIQIPAFLCRQTDLVVAAAETGKPVNIKKAQFMSPWDMKNIVEKAADAGNQQLLLTERGAVFGYQNLVSDMRSLVVMRSFGYPVIYDATHSVAQPGGAGTASGGQREFVPALCRAAAAVGIDALFLEVHPRPEQAKSDAATMWPLEQLAELLRRVKDIDTATRGLKVAHPGNGGREIKAKR